LDEIEILITDYSGVYFDFLLLNRPIIFYPYDYGYYKNSNRGFLLNYAKNTAGKKVYNITDLKKELLNILIGNDNYKKERIKMKKRFFKYIDGRSSERLTTQLLKIK
jgi:CDP-glycerol glycerophosphotransferase (TagB/SpsB family)